MSKQPPPAPTTSAIGPCPTVIQIVGRPGSGMLPRTIAPPDLPLIGWSRIKQRNANQILTGGFLLLQNFCVAISVSPHVCFVLVLILICMFLR